MQVVKNLPIIFLMLLAGCIFKEPSVLVLKDDPVPDTQRVETQTPVVDKQGIGTNLFKVIKIIGCRPVFVSLWLLLSSAWVVPKLCV